MYKLIPHRASAGQAAGFTIVELLVSLLLMGILAVAIAQGTTVSLTLSKQTRVSQLMHNLAVGRLEEISGTKASFLTAGTGVEAEVSAPGTGFTFTRTTAITLESENTRAVTVTVASNGAVKPQPVIYKATLPVWE